MFMTTLKFIAIFLLVAPTATSSNLTEYHYEQENDNNNVTVDSTLVNTQNFTLPAFEYHQHESDYIENLTQPTAAFEHNNNTTAKEEDTNHHADDAQETKDGIHQRGGRRERVHDFIDKQLERSSDEFAEFRDNDETVDNIFSSYQEIFERNYESTQEKRLRRSLFKKHLMNIIKTNSNSNLAHKASINAFSDMTVEEFNAQKKGLKIPKNSKRRLDNDDDNDDDRLSRSSREDTRNRYRKTAERHGHARHTSPSLDWVSLGRVTSVKDQLQCGDCYAFATMAVLEGLWMNTAGNLVDFSPQELTNCSSAYGNSGCNGGFFTASIDYLNSNNGSVSLWSDHNDTSVVGTCLMSTMTTPYQFGTIQYAQVSVGDEAQLLKAVNQGPVWIGINADTSTFMYYSSGVINLNSSACSPNSIDHAVTLVGYGNNPVTGLDYWKIKNSWSTEWGEDGYVRIARGKNVCGVASYAFTATVS
ncbi:unnamed protein product [Rotaria magnacalcarata]